MNRFFTANVILLLLGSAISAQDKPPENLGNPEQVREERHEDFENFIKRVSFIVAGADRDSVEVRYENKGGTKGAFSQFDEDTTGVSSPGLGWLRRKRGETEDVYALDISRGAEGSRFEVRVAGRLYHIRASAEIQQEFVAVKAPPPIPWDTFYCPGPTRASGEIRREVLQASVRVLTPKGIGGATIAVPPEGSEIVLKERQYLVVGAGHVVPKYLKDAEIFIDVFSYDRNLKPGKYQRYPATLLKSARSKALGDVACLLFSIEKGDPEITPRPIAESRRWFSREIEYLRVGCPAGSPPELETVRAVQGYRDEESPETGTVDIQAKSEDGHSGGGLFDADGVLMAICSATSEEAEPTLIGPGLLRRLRIRKFPRQTIYTSLFYHAHSATLLFLEADKEAVEETRWLNVRVPAKSRHGVSSDAEEAFTVLREQVDMLTRNLGDDRTQVKEKLNQAIDAYQSSLLK